MKARLMFYCVAAVALVLFLAATSRATERRDPVLNPNSEQATASGRTTDTRPAQHRTHPKKTSHAAKDPHSQASQKNPVSGAGSSSKGK